MTAAPRTGARATVGEHKLRVPRVQGTLVQRCRLLSRLAGQPAGRRSVTLVCAGAGAGKTTLLAEHCRLLAQTGAAVAWLSIDRDDNDPFALWSGIVEACDRATAAQAFRALSVPADPARSLLLDFVEAIDAQPDPVWLVLDDLHEVVEPAALEELESLLLAMPTQLRLLIGCRHDPPLPLTRMIVEGTAAEIRAADLAFDRGEADELLRGHGVMLDGDDLSALLDRTEGWAAGLKLAALQLAGHDDPSKLVASFAGDDRPVADYLVTEIISRLPDETAEVLLASAVPEWLTVSLACELSGRDDAGAVLDGLAKENALVYRVGKFSYRLHSLLRGYLLAEVERRDSAAARGLHVRAAEWFAGHALPAPALDHATAAEDWPGVVEILRRDGLGLLLSGDGDSVAAALTHLPADLAAEPTIALTAATAALCDHDVVAVREQLDVLRPQADAGELTPYHAAVLIAEARLQGTVPDEIGELAEAAGSGGGPDVELLALSNRGMLHTAAGDYAAAARDLSAAHQLTRGRGRADVDCLSHLAWNSLVSGDLPTAVEFADQALAQASRSGAATGPETLPAYLVRAWAAWQQIDVRSAEQLVSVAGTVKGDAEPAIRCAVELLASYVACGQTVGNRSALARRQRDSLGVVADQLPPSVLSTYCLTELGLAMSACDEAWAADVMDVAQSKLDGSSDVMVLDALVRANHGRSGVRAVLDTALSEDMPRQCVDTEIAGLLLLAHLADENGEPVRAHDAVRRSLDLAAESLSIRELTAAPARVLRHMSRARGRFGEREELVEKVLLATKNATGPMRPAYLAGEALTQREIEVLRDLPSMLSLSEIADAHVVSVNTVKTHLKAIYRKLAVTSRRGAVARARDAGLL